jgi:GWxTD domain-containing protein
MIRVHKIVTILILSASFFLLQIFAGFAFDKNKIIEAENCYQQALEHFHKGENDLAIVKLKTALKLNRKLAKAYHQLALIYMDEGTVHGRFKATIELEKALKLEPNNIEFLFNNAMLNLKKGFTGIAEGQFKKIVALDPQNYLAYYRLALLKEEEMLHYQDMISIEPGSDGIIFMDSFAKKLHQQAADYYKQAISVNPKFSDAYYRLALIYYEFDNYDEMIQLLESAVKIIPVDKNCHLFLGFAYQNVGKFNQAATEYQLAKELMSSSEKELLESINIILTPEQDKQCSLVSDVEKKSLHQAFWKSKDPFYLTEFNERELEHFSRVAYANLRFSKPEKNIEGWQTDPGKVMIRYGKPDFKYRTRPYLGAFVGHGRNPLHHSKEIWIYPGFDFIFEDRYLSSNYTFAWGDRPGTDYKEIYGDMIKKFPDYYQLIPDSQFFDTPYDIVAFKGQNHKTELAYCYSIPANDLNPSGLENQDFQLLQGLFLFDKSWNSVIKRTKEILFRSENLVTVNSKSYYSYFIPVELNPGNYYFALEFEHKKTGKRSRVFQECKVDTFFNDKFQMSDILFATGLEPPNLNVLPSRSDFKFNPNPLRVYRIGQPIVIYYEIYNLTQDQAGETHFRIEYQIGKDFQSESSIKKLLTNIGIMKRGGEVTAGYEYTGNTSSELQYQNIILDPNMIGRVMIGLKATDLTTGAVAQRQETFTVIR